MDGEDAANETSSKLFATRVTVAGLQEAYAGKKFERYAFRISIVLAATAIFYSSYLIICKYIGHASIFGNTDVVGEQAPFPNVTICGPEAMKRGAFLELTEKYGGDKVGKFLSMLNASIDDAIDEFLYMTSYAVRARPLTPVVRLGLQAATDIIASLGNTYMDFINLTYPTCSDMFSGCRFENVGFNCCDATELLLFDSRICYQFSLNRIPSLANMTKRTGGIATDTSNVEISGLVIDASIYWPDVIFWDDTATSGFNIFIGALPTPWSTPIAIPSGMDAIIVLSPPTKLRELSDCRSEENLPKMIHTSYYDEFAIQCIIEILERETLENYGCNMPALNYRPDNKTMCTPGQAYSLNNIFSGETFSQNPDNRIKAKETMLRDQGRLAFSQCLPFCNRTIYDVISASYGSIQQQNDLNWSEDNENVSWSRIRIFFPASSYKILDEEYASPAYVALCEIGGVMGVYLGLSMITVLQIFAYGAIWFSKKKRHNVGVVES